MRHQFLLSGDIHNSLRTEAVLLHFTLGDEDQLSLSLHSLSSYKFPRWANLAVLPSIMQRAGKGGICSC